VRVADIQSVLLAFLQAEPLQTIPESFDHLVPRTALQNDANFVNALRIHGVRGEQKRGCQRSKKQSHPQIILLEDAISASTEDRVLKVIRFCLWRRWAWNRYPGRLARKADLH